MKKLGLVGLLLGAAVGLVLLVSACQGPAGTTGPQGPQGSPGPAGPQGPAGLVAGDGLVLKITKVDVGADLRPVVSFTLADAKGNPLDMAVLDANTPRFTMAKITADGGQYVNYILNTVKGAPYTINGVTKQPAMTAATQPAMDVGGDFTTVKTGSYTYKFKTVLSADYDKTATNAVGGQASRNNRVIASNDVYYFVPAGGTPTVMRQIVTQASCNQCHDPLKKHGIRIDTRLCVLCHTPQNMDPDTGGTFDFKVFIHRIHDGSALPSVVAGGHDVIFSGTTAEDYSDVTFPQNIKNCTTCHGAPPAGMKPEDYAKLAPQASNYMNNPSRAACGSCHDDVNFITGANHPGGSQADDKQCKICHQSNGSEFDSSVVGAHTIPERSKTLKGVNFKIIAASVMPGQKASVDFSITDNSGSAIDPNKMDSLSVTIAWPTTDYAQRVNETINTIPAAGAAPFVHAGTLTDLGSDNWRYTTALVIDASWNTGSAGVGLQGYKITNMKINLGKDYQVRESNVNPVTYVSVVNGLPAVARRVVVDRDKCNACHLDLGSSAGVSIHGGARRNPQYCVMCHNATFTDESSRTAAKLPMPPESLKWGYFIHTIHAGSSRATATTIAGINTQSILFPGNLQDCLKCHVAGTYGLPLKAGVGPSIITQAGKVVATVQPITAVCSGCHTGKDTFDTHAAIMTSSTNIEACPSCHGAGKAFDVTTVHVVQ